MLNRKQLRPWLLGPVHERLRLGRGDFLAELRPTVALFVRFGGIDYDGDAGAGNKLDAYLRWVQSVVARYDGTLIDVNFGDKGSYLYVNFGAPVAHEDNAERAAATALALHKRAATPRVRGRGANRHQPRAHACRCLRRDRTPHLWGAGR